MPTINENIAELQQKTTNLISAHNDIKDAIISKGGKVSSGDKFSDFPDDIGTIRKDLTSININENGVYKNGTLDTVTGNTYPIEIVANGSPIVSITMDGDTVQNETPTPTAPVDVNGVGVLETIGEHSGQYKIPISCGGVTTDVYLGEVETTRYIKKMVLTGQEAWDNNIDPTLFGVQQLLNLEPFIPQVTAYCTQYIYNPIQSGLSANMVNGEFALQKSQNSYNLFFRNTDYTSLSDFKAYLQQQYANGTPVCVWYVLETPETTTINEPLMKIGDYKDQLTLTDSDITIPTVTGNNVVDYNLNIKPSLTSLTYYKLGINKTIVSDTLPIEYESNGNPLESYSINGNTVQNGTPSPSSPVDVNGVGVLETIGEHSGQYKIPILNNSQTTNVYLGEVESTRQIKKLVLTGTESWVIYGGNYFSSVIDSDSRQYKLCYCTHLESTFSSGIYVDSGGSRLKVFSASVSSVATTLDEWKTYLQQQYANGTPVTVWYVLASPKTGIVNEPLMKIDDYADSIVDTQTQIPTVYGDNTFDVGTTIKPSSVSITYDDINIIGYDEINVDVPNTYTVEDEGKVVNNSTLVAQTAMPTEITANDTYDTTLYNSIVVNVPTGSSAGTKGDVTFYDYDGTVVTSYSKDEFANLSALPANPTHEGLTAQGWNWSLNDAKTYVTAYGKLNIGQMYVTDDGCTRLHIRLGEGRLKPYLGLTGGSSGTAVSIDWGDGSVVESVTLNTSTVYTPHEYSTSGDYTISITVTNGRITLNGDNYTHTNSNILRKSSYPNTYDDKVYQNSLIGIEIGTNARIGSDAFDSCYSLTSITIPNTVTSIGSYAFYGCYSLTSITIPNGVAGVGQYAFQHCYALQTIIIPSSVRLISSYAFYTCYSLTSITIPDTVTSIGNSTFYTCYSLQSITIPVTTIDSDVFHGCYALTSITIPDKVTSIGTSAFDGCYSLTSIDIPDNVTSIGNSAFNQCCSLSEAIIGSGVTSIGTSAFIGCSGLGSIKFTSTTPPTVSSSSVWDGVPTDCIIFVPINTYAAYTTATNYPSSSTYTYLVFGTYESGSVLPSTSTDNYSLTWYATIADAIAQTNPITTGNGNEVYARCVSA